MKIKKINDIEDDDKQDDDIEDDDIEDEKLVRIPIAAVLGFKEQIKPTFNAKHTTPKLAKACNNFQLAADLIPCFSTMSMNHNAIKETPSPIPCACNSAADGCNTFVEALITLKPMKNAAMTSGANMGCDSTTAWVGSFFLDGIVERWRFGYSCVYCDMTTFFTCF